MLDFTYVHYLCISSLQDHIASPSPGALLGSPLTWIRQRHVSSHLWSRANKVHPMLLLLDQPSVFQSLRSSIAWSSLFSFLSFIAFFISSLDRSSCIIHSSSSRDSKDHRSLSSIRGLGELFIELCVFCPIIQQVCSHVANSRAHNTCAGITSSGF